jgi:recombination protein RecA
VVSKTRTSLIFTNQIRMKIGVMFGSPETTSGGNALKFYSSVRMDIRRIGAIKDGEVVSGNRTKVKVVKNKVAPPFRIAEFDILYGEGISYEGDVIDLGAAAEVIKRSGTWYSYGEERLGQGKEAARRFLKDNPKITAEIDAKIRAHFEVGTTAAPAKDSVAPDKAAPSPEEVAEAAGVKVAVPAAATGRARASSTRTAKK